MVATKEKTDSQKILSELRTITEDIARELKSRVFPSFGELREFLKHKMDYAKNVGEQLGDKSAGGYINDTTHVTKY